MSHTITLENVPEHLYEFLKNNATENDRSLESELIALLEYNCHLPQTPIEIVPEECLARARNVRKKDSGLFLTQEILEEIKKMP